MILEKAWVKLFGNYLSAEKMSISRMMSNVLPAPNLYYSFDIDKLDQFFEKTLTYKQKKYVICASSTNKPDLPSGIVPQHAYSVLGVYKYNNLKIFKIRNPWGKTEYQGEYG